MPSWPSWVLSPFSIQSYDGAAPDGSVPVCWAMVCRCSSGDWPSVRSIVCQRLPTNGKLLFGERAWVQTFSLYLECHLYPVSWSHSQFHPAWNSVKPPQPPKHRRYHRHLKMLNRQEHQRVISLLGSSVGWRSGGFIQLLVVVDD